MMTRSVREAAALDQASLLGLTRAALYEKLGWPDYAAWERLRLARLAHQRKVADTW